MKKVVLRCVGVMVVMFLFSMGAAAEFGAYPAMFYTSFRVYF